MSNGALLVLSIAVLPALGCDWAQSSFLNSVPIDGETEVVRVYLAVDGLSPSVVEAARAHGLAGLEDTSMAEMVAMFPVSSDASWTRIFHARRLQGFELHFYDPVRDELVNNGYAGLIAHGLPQIDGVVDGPPYLDVFDYHADGYLDVASAYLSPELSFGESLDGLFVALSGRSETQDVFVGYFAEIDILGHMRSRAEMVHAFEVLWNRIQRFKADNRERAYIFTLMSDHGFDDVPAEPRHFVDFPSEMRAHGVEPVDALKAGRGVHRLYAVPIVHTPVSYIGLHTEPSLAEEVARSCSMSPTVDLAIAPASPDPDLSMSGATWFSAWRGGRRVLRAAHVPSTQTYYVHQSSDLRALEIDLRDPKHDGAYVFASDAAWFDASAGRYPDLLHRIRTAIQPVTVEHPANVLVSFLRPYTSKGFSTFTKVEDQARFGFHGSIDAASSLGVVLTEQRALPPSVRPEEIFALFPDLRRHLERARAIDLRLPDPGAVRPSIR